jgi:hypothetical protein
MAQSLSDASKAAQQKAADQYGISLQDYQDLLAKYPPVYQQNSQGGQYGTSAGGQYMQNPKLDNALQTLSLVKKYGGQGGQAAAPAAPVNTSGNQSYYGAQPTITTGDSGSSGGGNSGGGGGNNTVATPGQQPEQVALQQIAQIDPASEALRNQLAQSYLTPLQQAGAPKFDPNATPSAANIQSYLDLYKQTDPQGYASMQALNTAEDASLKQATDQLNLGSRLDPVTARQVEQQTRLGQAARGNVYGTPQMVEEAMTTGQAGLALQQQRQAAAQAAQGAMQGYLTSGATAGAVANNLYNQGYQRNMQTYQQQLAALGAAQGGALSYLGSGSTPYQMGAGYVNNANNAAAAAAQGGPVYQPASLGASSQASQIPQYGLDIGQQAQNWYNSLSAYSNPGGATKNKGAAAAGGALSGALSGAVGGATIGSAVPGLGTLAGAAIGAGTGALAGGAGGYFS